MKTNKATKTVKTGDIKSAMELLKGGEVIAHDRRASDATPIDFVKTRKGRVTTIMTSYGVSNRMHMRLTSLASSVDYVGGRPVYAFGA